MTYNYYEDYRKQYPDDIEFLSDIGTYAFPNELTQENLADIKNILSHFDDVKTCQLISELRVWMDNNTGGQGQFNKWIKVFLEDKNFPYETVWMRNFKYVIEKAAYSELEKVERKELFELFFNHTQWTKDSLNQVINHMEKDFLFGITSFNSALSICLNYIVSSKDYNAYFDNDDKKQLLKLLATDHHFNRAMANYYIGFEHSELKTLIQNMPTIVSLFDLFKENNQEIQFLIPKLTKQFFSSTYYEEFEVYVSPTNLLNYIQKASVNEQEFKALFFNENLNQAIGQISKYTTHSSLKMFSSLNQFFEYYDSICDKMGYEKINIQFTDNFSENLAQLEQVFIYQKMNNQLENTNQDKKKMKL